MFSPNSNRPIWFLMTWLLLTSFVVNSRQEDEVQDEENSETTTLSSEEYDGSDELELNCVDQKNMEKMTDWKGRPVDSEYFYLDQRCYSGHKIKLNWTDAQMKCKAIEATTKFGPGDLAIMTSKTTMLEIVKKIEDALKITKTCMSNTTGSFWLGGAQIPLRKCHDNVAKPEHKLEAFRWITDENRRLTQNMFQTGEPSPRPLKESECCLEFRCKRRDDTLGLVTDLGLNNGRCTRSGHFVCVQQIKTHVYTQTAGISSGLKWLVIALFVVLIVGALAFGTCLIATRQ